MDIVIVGSQKSGTTWLFSMLAQNPGVGYAYQKEIHFFDAFHHKTIARKWAEKRAQVAARSVARQPELAAYFDYVTDAGHVGTDDWYRNIFLLKPENADRLASGKTLKFLESSPSYMAMPRIGVKHMARVLPDLEPILIIRDPVRRMVSGLSMRLSKFSETGMPGDRKIIKVIDDSQAGRGSYSRAVPMLRRQFKTLHVIPFQRIVQEPVALLRDIEHWFGLEPADYAEVETKKASNTGKVVLSEAVLAHVRALCAPEYDFLRREFGAGYLDRI